MNRTYLLAGLAALMPCLALASTNPPAAKPAKTPATPVAKAKPAPPVASAPLTAPTPAPQVLPEPSPTTPADLPTPPTAADPAAPEVPMVAVPGGTSPKLTQPKREEVEIEVTADPHTGLFNPGYFVLGQGGGGGMRFTPGYLEKPVSVDIKDAKLQEALDAVAKALGDDVKIAMEGESKETPDARVTIKARQVRAASLLDVITQNAGLGWRVEGTDMKRVRVSKASPSHPHLSLRQNFVNADARTRLEFMNLADAVSMTRGIRETRSVFSCPHCKARTTVLRERQQPKCPKCTRTFQGDWQFCPADGTKRPANPNEWRYCPSCGKRVEAEKAALQDVETLEEHIIRRTPDATPDLSFTPKQPSPPVAAKPVVPSRPAPVPVPTKPLPGGGTLGDAPPVPAPASGK